MAGEPGGRLAQLGRVHVAVLVQQRVELDAFARLPDPVPVFRGYSRDGSERGLSWTTDRARAEAFGHRLASLEGEPRVAVATVETQNTVVRIESVR